MITVCHMYPDLLNLYGDRGNVIAFLKRCMWRNIPVNLVEVGIGESIDFEKIDFLFLGGGSDTEQNLIARDLMKRKKLLSQAVENGLVVLAICGGYQLLGRYYRTLDGKEIPGLSIMNHYTVAGKNRLTGNVAIEIELDGKKHKIVGFENHAGRTFLDGVKPLGKILSGFGNNAKDGTEGAVYKNVFCSYLHGPVLPKNPELTDHLIKLALKRRGIQQELLPLNDQFEKQAKEYILSKLL